MKNWIEVKEELPNNYRNVIVFHSVACTGWLNSHKEWVSYFGEFKAKITHWMPFPESPME